VTTNAVSLRIRYDNEFAPARLTWDADGFSAPRLIPGFLDLPGGGAKPSKKRVRGGAAEAEQ